MGWGRYFFLGHLGQRLDIHELNAAIRQDVRVRLRERTRRRSDREGLEERFAALEHESDELRLHLAVVVRHLLQKRLLVQTEMEALVAEIDAEDGVVDGGHAGPVV